MSTPAATLPPPSATKRTRWAWASLAATVLTLPLGVVVANVILGALGYSVDDPSTLPVGALGVAGLAALAIILAPVLGAFLLGRGAVRAGDERGRLPMLIAGIGGVLFLAANLMPLALRALGF